MILLAFVAAASACGSRVKEQPSHDADASAAEPSASLESAVLKGDPETTASYDCPAALEAARRSDSPAPVLVLRERNPWRAVSGSDSPVFALYEDGRAIYRDGERYRTATLGASEQAALLGGDDPLAGLGGGYSASRSSDEPMNDLLLYRGNKPVFVSVYGDLHDPDVRARVPARILTLLDRLEAFRPSASAAWLPEKIEVMIWPYDHAVDPSIAWPKRWPGLHAPDTVRRDRSRYSLFVPSSERDRLEEFLARQRPKGAIEIDGRKWSADLRFPFPHERLWMMPEC